MPQPVPFGPLLIDHSTGQRPPLSMARARGCCLLKPHLCSAIECVGQATRSAESPEGLVAEPPSPTGLISCASRRQRVPISLLPLDGTQSTAVATRSEGDAVRTTTLEEAVWEIAQATQDDETPFLFLIGAGVSAPEIPLASAIADDCQRRAESARSYGAPPAGSLDRYSFWFERAFPQPKQRQRYLADLLGDVRISQACLRLAHLMSAGVLGRLAVTLNFDEGLERALSLFDVPYLVCDHPATVERIETDRDTSQIVHVHGTYWFYDCCNLRGEIADRAMPLAQGMQSLLDRILATRSPLVVGYSGWESDVVMTSLRRRLAGRLAFNIYWFSYSGDLSTLPDWLREHQDVVFVVPDEAPRDGTEDDDGPGDDPVLEAAACFEALITEFDLPAPVSVSDPVAALVERLKRQVPSLGVDAGYEDLYQFSGVIAALENLLQHGTDDPTSTLEQARDAMRQSRYEEALRLCLLVPSADDAAVEGQVASILASSAARAKTPITKLIADEPRIVDRVRNASDRDPKVRLALGTLLNRYGRALISDNPVKAIEVLREAVQIDAGESKGRIRQLVRSYSSLANAYAALEQWREIEPISLAIRQLAGDDPDLQADALVAEVNLATALMRLNRADEAVKMYQRLEPAVLLSLGKPAYWRFWLRYMECLSATGDAATLHLVAEKVLLETAEGEPSRSAEAAVVLATDVLSNEPTFD